jgi:hypothetical protein
LGTKEKFSVFSGQKIFKTFFEKVAFRLALNALLCYALPVSKKGKGGENENSKRKGTHRGAIGRRNLRPMHELLRR